MDISKTGRVMAHLLEPPGLACIFSSKEDMYLHLPKLILEHLAWLKKYGEKTFHNSKNKIKIEIKEEVNVSGNFESGDDVGFYKSDTNSLTEPSLEYYLKLLNYSRNELLNTLNKLPSASIHYRRKKGKRTIYEVLQHIGRAELWYITRIEKKENPAFDSLYNSLNGEIFNALKNVRREFIKRMNNLSPAQKKEVFIPSHHTKLKEKWTARKVLRRALEHEREHTRNINNIYQKFLLTSK